MIQLKPVLIRTWAVLGLALLAAGCRVGEEENIPEVWFETRIAVTDRFEQPATIFATGEQIRIRLSIVNITDSAKELSIYTHCTGDGAMQVKDANGNVVSSLGQGTACPAVVTEKTVTLNPNQAHVTIWQWDQKGPDNTTQIAAGVYSASGTYSLVTRPQAEGVSPAQRIEIRP